MYVGLEEYTNGQAIVRNIGFYPNGLVSPLNPNVPGKSQEDTRSYDVSLTIEVSREQFEGVITNLTVTANSDYNLNSNNCTNFVLNACVSNGVYVATSPGSWWGGGGLNPSDLGEDIRTMTLQPNMTRNTTGGYPQVKQGICP